MHSCRVRVALVRAVLVLPFVGSCTPKWIDARESQPFQGALDPRVAAPVAKRHLVAVPTFATSWNADALVRSDGATLGTLAAAAVEEVLEPSPKVVLDRTARDGAAALEIRGRLVGDTRGVRHVELALATPDGHVLSRVTRPCDFVRERELDLSAVRSAARELVPQLEAMPWSSCVLDTSTRYLVISAGRECRLTLNEMLVVRLRGEPSTASASATPRIGNEVARVFVDSFLERKGGSVGAYCRLWGGSFSGFDPSELVVVEH